MQLLIYKLNYLFSNKVFMFLKLRSVDVVNMTCFKIQLTSHMIQVRDINPNLVGQCLFLMFNIQTAIFK